MAGWASPAVAGLTRRAGASGREGRFFATGIAAAGASGGASDNRASKRNGSSSAGKDQPGASNAPACSSSEMVNATQNGNIFSQRGHT
jgi:hypothetical protein